MAQSHTAQPVVRLRLLGDYHTTGDTIKGLLRPLEPKPSALCFFMEADGDDEGRQFLERLPTLDNTQIRDYHTRRSNKEFASSLANKYSAVRDQINAAREDGIRAYATHGNPSRADVIRTFLRATKYLYMFDLPKGPFVDMSKAFFLSVTYAILSRDLEQNHILPRLTSEIAELRKSGGEAPMLVVHYGSAHIPPMVVHLHSADGTSIEFASGLRHGILEAATKQLALELAADVKRQGDIDAETATREWIKGIGAATTQSEAREAALKLGRTIMQVSEDRSVTSSMEFQVVAMASMGLDLAIMAEKGMPLPDLPFVYRFLALMDSMPETLDGSDGSVFNALKNAQRKARLAYRDIVEDTNGTA